MKITIETEKMEELRFLRAWFSNSIGQKEFLKKERR